MMNSIYATYFITSPPARSTVEVARLPKDVLVEIECIVDVKNLIRRNKMKTLIVYASKYGTTEKCALTFKK